MINTKNILKKLIFTFIVAIVLTIVGGQTVMAAQPSSISAVKEGKKVGGSTWFHVKTSGNYKVFCTSGLNVATPAGTGRSCSLITSGQWSESTQAGIASIISEYNSGKISGSYDPYWYAEIAINSYLGNSVYGAGSNSLVVSLVSKAKAAAKKASANFQLSLSSSNLTFTKSGNYYVSNTITVKDVGGYLDSFSVSVSGTSGVEVINKKSNSFQVRFPASNVAVGKSVKVTAKVTGKKSYRVAKNYNCGSGVQHVTINYVETKSKSATKNISGTVTRKGNAIEITKVNSVTGKNVAGATLVLKNSSGKQIDKWVSTTSAHKITNLTAGKYTLSEIKAPSGYKLSTKTVSITVKEDGKTIKVSFENAPETGVKVLKVDGVTGKAVAGAKLQIKNSKGTVVKTLTSGTKAIELKLDAGDYTLTEVEAPDGYKKTSETVKFTVNKNGTIATVTMKNYPETGVKVLKIDGVTGKAVAGAKLQIKNSKGTVVKTLTSGTKAIELKLDAGDYTLTEVEAPDGYKKTSETVKFTVNKNGTIATVTMKNYPETGVKVLKVDGVTGKAVAGAKLQIKNSKGTVVKTLTSGTKAIELKLDAGDYTLTEVEAPDGYKKTSETVKFTVNKNGTIATVTMKNYPETGVKVLKVDGITGKAVAGAKLQIKNSKGTVVKTLTSGTKAIELKLDAGDYTLTEVEAPDGYKKTSETVKFTVNKNGTIATVTMKNYPETGVKVLKVDGITGKAVAGAKLQIKNSKGTVVKTLTSGTKAIELKLDAGDYTLTEVEAPDGYKKTSETVKFTVNKNGTIATVTMKNYPETGAEISKVDVTTGKELPGATLVIKDSTGKEIKKWVSTNEPTYFELDPGKYTLTETIAPEGYKLSTKTVSFEVKEDGTTTKVTMENAPITGAEISKVDATTSKELPGATLVIKDSTGKEIKKWVSTNEPTYFELDPGKYTLTETIAPKGYKLSTETISFEVKEDGTTTKVQMINEPLKTGAQISKQDITNKTELPGATLVVKDAEGNEVASWVSTNEPRYIELTPGKYTLSETIAPAGYKLSTETISFEVKEDGTTTNVVMYNEPSKSGAQISKQDVTTKTELPGATLVVKDAEGNEVASWVSTSEPRYIELKPGNYTLSETIAPVGYKLSTETIPFEVREDGTTTSVVMYNEPSKVGVKISKQDITTKTELPGATLVVKDANGNEIASWVSTNEPRYIELEPGDYTLTEITAPNGYDLSYEVVRFTVNEDGTTDGDVIMYNSKTPVTSDKNLLFTVIGFISAGLVGTVAIKKLKHQM